MILQFVVHIYFVLLTVKLIYSSTFTFYSLAPPPVHQYIYIYINSTNCVLTLNPKYYIYINVNVLE